MKLTIIIALAIGTLLVVSGREPQQKGDSKKSPMPAVSYDHWRGEDSLINPTKNSADSELSGLAERFAKSDKRARANMRSSLSPDEFYTLLNFSDRSAVFAIREKNVNWVRNGLSAVAMTEAKRIDFRDVLMTLSLLYHSANRIGANANQLFQEAARLSEPNIAELLTGFINRPAEEKDLQTSWGRDEVETEGGVGFIGRGFKDYHPSYDLKKIAIDIADVVAKDKYLPSVEVAADLPAVWLESPENPSLKSVLKKVRAGASVHGELRPNEHPTYKSQILMIFLVEMEDSAAARELLEMSKRERPTRYSMVGVSEGKLFCLVIGKSFVQGVESFETPQSLQRFSTLITEVLKKYSKTG